ncbi:hypothetical protein AK95_25590 [Paenibacillus sp. LC231]|nr:hypothetical protein AK95_25590 [Paenibacillus sp. LC231]
MWGTIYIIVHNLTFPSIWGRIEGLRGKVVKVNSMLNVKIVKGVFHFLYCMQVSSIVTDYSYCGKIVMVTGSLALCSLI